MSIRKENELPEDFMIRMGIYFSGTVRDDYFRVAGEITVLRTRLAALEVRHNELRDAVAWERECGYLWEFGPVLSNIANDELLWSMKRARAEVDDLLCKKQSKEISNA